MIYICKNNRKLLSLLMTLLILVMTGCGSADKSTEKVKEEDKKGIVIGLSIDSLVVERWQRDCDVFAATVQEYDKDASVNIQNANGDAETQREQIRYLIDKRVDVLVIVCIDSEGLSDLVEEAHNAGIPVIAYDRLIRNSDVDLYISFDNERVGELMGEELVRSGLENGNVMMLAGPEEDNNVSLVNSGFEKVMKDNNVNIKSKYYTPNWKAEEAANYLNDHLTELDDVDAIMCGNDNIATTIIRTLSEARLAGKIKITGQDADLEACQRVVEGTQVMTVYKPVEKLAQVAADYAIQLAEGKELKDVNVTINDGSFDVPYYYIEPIAVTKDNIDETIIESGFHVRDEVYMNVVD